MVNFTSSPSLQMTIEELEVQRKRIVSIKRKGWGSIILGIIAFIVLAKFSIPIAGIFLGASLIVFGGIKLYQIGNDAKIYKSRFKLEIIGAALQSIDTSLTIEPENGIWEEEFKRAQLFTQGIDRYHSEDLIKGKAGKTSFCFAEVHAEYKTETQTKNGRQEHWYDILKGIVFVADFNKNFNGVTVVRPKDFGSSIGAWFSKNIFSFGDKNVVELENTSFCKEFVTYSTDQIEARYILTPALMEKICTLNNRCSQTISLSFINSSAYIAFPLQQNYFEAPIFKSLLKPDLLDEDLSVLHFMYAIIEELDLNTRIWTKT